MCLHHACSNYAAGTPFYVSPEVISSGRMTKRSDIYSFGVMAWEIYTHNSPWVRLADGSYAKHPKVRGQQGVFLVLCALQRPLPARSSPAGRAPRPSPSSSS